MTQRPPQLARRMMAMIFLIVASLSVAAASCENKKPVNIKPADSAKPAADAGQPADAAATEKALEPDDVGPKAPAIFMMGSLKGYTEPCGCTLDVLLGGLDRIVGYVDAARALYDGVEIVDGGNLFFETVTLEEHQIVQEKAKVELLVTALKRLKIAVTVPGEKDFALGADFYTTQLAAAGIKAIGANIKIGETQLPAEYVGKTGGQTVLYIGVGEPELYKETKGVTVAAAPDLKPVIAASDAKTVVLLVHGRLPFAKELLEKYPEADFALVGAEPRETDQADSAGKGFTLEPYDQGRYLGVLKLYVPEGESSGDWVNARRGSKAELEKIERQIEHVNKSLDTLPPSKHGEEPTIMLTLRDRLAKLKARRDEIHDAKIEVSKTDRSFVWRTIPIAPGYAEDPAIKKARDEYNRSLAKLNADLEVIPAVAGKPEYIGTEVCKGCHFQEYEFYKTTSHAHAWGSLVERAKDYDQKCVGCHVVGYEEPGGSVVGKVRYRAEISLDAKGEKKFSLQKDLRNVGCETCHGPGSFHRGAPLDDSGKPQHIRRDAPAEVCAKCHVEEHSPRFDFGVYSKQIVGLNHGE